MYKFLLIIFSVFSTIAFSSCEKDTYACENNICRGPYLQMTGSNSVVIKWRSFNAAPSWVKIGNSPLNLEKAIYDERNTKEHEVKINNLDPNQKYFYTVGNTPEEQFGDETSFFHTAPPAGSRQPIRFWVSGDAGSGNPFQNLARNGLLKYNKDQKVDLWLWLGDNAYTKGTDEEYQKHVFTNHFEDQMKNIPVFSVPGNHDYGRAGYLSAAAATDNFPYYDIFVLPENGELGGVPSGTEHYYSMNYGNVHLIFLDSHGCESKPGSEMYNWLEQDLKSASQDWIIVSVHNPPYSKGSHDSDKDDESAAVRQYLLPLLEKYNTDLVLSGHSHGYERSALINGHYGTSDQFNAAHLVSDHENTYYKQGKGTVYVVNGAGGNLDGKQKDAPHKVMKHSAFLTPGSMVIDINGSTLSAAYINPLGKEADEFKIIK